MKTGEVDDPLTDDDLVDEEDSAWLLAKDRGEDVSHVSTETREDYADLERLLAELPLGEPDPSWHEGVLKAARAQDKPSTTWGRFVAWLTPRWKGPR